MNKKLQRLPREGAISGVCAGIALYNGWDKSWVRTLWVVGTFVTSMMGLFFIGPVVYVVLWITLPVRNDLFGFGEPNQDPFAQPWNASQPGYAPWTAPAEPTTYAQPDPQPGTQYSADSTYPPFTASPLPPPLPPKKSSGRMVMGLVLLCIGVMLLVHQLDLIEWVDVSMYFPGIISILGLYFMFTSFDSPMAAPEDPVEQPFTGSSESPADSEQK